VVRVTYIGHSCILIASNGTQILIDPYIEGNPNAVVPSKNFSPKLILVTHAHSDHLGDTVKLAKKFKAKVLATNELAKWLANEGVETIGAHFGGKIPFDFGWVKLWPAMHTSTAPDSTNLGIAASFVVSIGGKCIYHAGDTALTSDMSLIGDDKAIDLACLPIGGQYTMGVDDAVKATDMIKPRVVLPIHYNTWDIIKADPEEFAQKVDKSPARTKTVILQPGEQLELP
jgi:L-ascorbate metabolism protein UlaG (beta-lactamase superfamily)